MILFFYIKNGSMHEKVVGEQIFVISEHSRGAIRGAHFLKAPTETSRTRKAIFSWSVSKNSEVCTPETSCMKETFVYTE